MITSFACDYETLKRLAESAHDILLDDNCPYDYTAADARDYLVARELKRISERKDARETLYDSLFAAAMQLTVAAIGNKAELTYGQKNDAYRLIDALNQFAKHLK